MYNCRTLNKASPVRGHRSRQRFHFRISRNRRARSQYGETPSPSDRDNNLRSIIKRKQNELAEYLSRFNDDAIEDRLSAALHSKNPNPHRFAQLVESIKMTQGRPVLIFELDRSLLKGSSEFDTLSALAQRFESFSADCLCISTDTDTSDGVKDIFTVTRSVKTPVFARDWYIHPLQILEAKEAGASGVLGVIACVSAKGTPLLSSYAAAIGIDAPVEVLNLKEVEKMEKHGVPMFCVNVAVGLSLAGIAGATADLTKGILEALPIGAVSVVGVRSEEEAGADALLIKHAFLPSEESDIRTFIEEIKYMTSGDD